MAIAVDLDGTLAEYHGWKGIDHIGAPIPAMMERVKNWMCDGLEVIIFTARADDPEAVRFVKEWLVEQGLGDLEVTNVKYKKFREFWDDRAVSIEFNTGRITTNA